jgi:hypothetical protein
VTTLLELIPMLLLFELSIIGSAGVGTPESTVIGSIR